MKTEPTAIIEIVRFVAILASTFFGLQITPEEQVGIVAGIGAVIAFASLLLAIWNRFSVFSPKTTQALVNKAGRSGSFDVGDPPQGAAG